MAKQFDRSAHGRLATFEQNALPPRCESCHGPGSKHAESGDAADIRSFKEIGVPEAADTCLSCHRQDHAIEWAGSEHAQSGVGCTSCHRIHQSREVAPGLMRAEGMTTTHATAPARRGSLSKEQPQLCYDCHKEQRAQFMSSSHHPVREGLMTCTSCHQPHGRNQGMLKTDERVNDLCYTCHTNKQGPFVFEHAPVEEDCRTCHNPHGTVANNLLKQGEPFLCLQCHELHFHSARLAPSGPASLPAASSNNPLGSVSFMASYNTRCTNCHNRIHGSDMPSQGVTGGGKALTR
jgi:DmsE family decaheme c-type cytochrome